MSATARAFSVEAEGAGPAAMGAPPDAEPPEGEASHRDAASFGPFHLDREAKPAGDEDAGEFVFP